MKVRIKQINPTTNQRLETTVPGYRVGPFGVHQTPESSEREWTVTHLSTGFAVQRFLPSEQRAMWLARKLHEIPVWNFRKPESAKKIPKEEMAQITVLRMDAMNGDCQGEVNDDC